MKPRARRIFLILGSLVLVGLGGFLWLWWAAPKHNIKEETLNRITLGMTTAEVNKVIGVPAGNYAAEPLGEKGELFLAAVCEMEELLKQSGTNEKIGLWVADSGAILLKFKDDRVSFKGYQAFHEDDFFTRIRKLLRWQ